MGAKRKSKKKSAPAKKGRAPAKKAKKSAARKAGARPNQMVHWEIQSQMPERLHRFYAETFGWKVDANNPMKYGMVSSKGRDGIDGGIGGSEHPGSRVVVYASVKSIPDTLARIESGGGRTIMPRTDLGMVVMGLYQDPEGNTMGLVEG
jgi:predicted enzyme related to lactoylglutathione lyase